MTVEIQSMLWNLPTDSAHNLSITIQNQKTWKYRNLLLVEAS